MVIFKGVKMCAKNNTWRSTIHAEQYCARPRNPGSAGGYVEESA